MNIGHYAPRLGAQGGISTYVRRMGQAQQQDGHGVHYFARSPEASQPNVRITEDDSDLFTQARALSLDVLHLHRPVNELPDERVPTVRTMHGNQGSCPSGSRYLARQGEPCHRAYSATGCLWGHLVDHCGSRRPHQLWANFQNIQQEQRLAASLPTFPVSRFLKEQMIRSGCRPDTLHVLPSPAPAASKTHTPPPTEGAPRFVFLGRIEPNKGVRWLLRAASLVEKPIQVDIAGSGSARYVQEMQALAEKQGLASRVTFYGWLESKAVEKLVRAARAVVFPSVWQEPAGLVTLEAAAMGRPVIASRVGGIPEYADEAFALLVPPNDEAALADGMARLARSPALAEQMGRAGRQVAQSRFSMRGFLQALYEHYDRVVAEQRPSARGGRRHSPASSVSVRMSESA